NFVGPYLFQDLEVDASVVMTNKSLTGPNRGYACGHLYFETERMMDLLAERLELDPVEVRRRNLIQPGQFPYRSPTRGLYDTAVLATTTQGQGHRSVVSQIVAAELGLTPEDVTVVDEMDTYTRFWSISSGTYSSRFGSVGTSAAALAARKLKAKLIEYAAHLM